MVLRAAIETVLADPAPPPAEHAAAPALLAALLPRLTGGATALSLHLDDSQLAALRYALDYQMRIRGYVVARPGAVNAMVDLHDKLQRPGTSPTSRFWCFAHRLVRRGDL